MRRGVRRDIVVKSILGLLVLIILALVLRSVYAYAFFRITSTTLGENGWSPAGSNPAVQIDEDMTFEASYLVFKVGSVRFQVLGKTKYDSLPSYRLRAYIDSYSGFPFVDFHSVYDTYADENTLYCLYNSRSQKDGQSWVYTTTRFQPDHGIIIWDQTRDGKFIREVELPLETNYTNGVSFIYYLRNMCLRAEGRQTALDIPIIDDTVRSSVKLVIDEKREPCTVAAFGYPVDSYRLSGHINFIGTFGITGDFVGWMAADSTALPLRADVKVFLGKVVVQLKEVKRAGGIPPRQAGNE
ncbi:MAG TPA: DUF3108 domain-containing protein [Candidatus Kryptonia bacterium]